MARRFSGWKPGSTLRRRASCGGAAWRRSGGRSRAHLRDHQQSASAAARTPRGRGRASATAPLSRSTRPGRGRDACREGKESEEDAGEHAKRDGEGEHEAVQWISLERAGEEVIA